MPFGAAVSEHPRTAHAVGEATGQVLDALDGAVPDLAVLLATAHHADAFAEAASAVRHLLGPSALLGATVSGVLAEGREVEAAGGVTLWAGSVGDVHTVGLGPGGSGPSLEAPPFEPTALLVLADPITSPRLLADVADRWPDLPVLGGVAAADPPRARRLVADGRPRAAGAVAAFLGQGAGIGAVVTQGVRPVGQPLVVTAAEGTLVRELAGRPAMARLMELAAAGIIGSEDVAAVERGAVRVGRLVDERVVEPGRGDYLVRPVVAVHPVEGWIALDRPVEVGATLRFHLADADAADDDLRAALTGRRAAGVLAFASADRGAHLFGTPHHDAEVVAEYLARPPTAGGFFAGVFGPVGRRSASHPSGVSLALFDP